jgi:hypothetical protein
VVIGTTDQYQTRDLAIAAINGLMMQVNAERFGRPGYSISVSDLIDHYFEVELSATAVWHSHAKRVINRYFLNNWIRSRWGALDFHSVRTVDVEYWLKTQKRADGALLANSTKAKIRSVFSVLFNHAIRYEWLEQGKNPIALVRQRAKTNQKVCQTRRLGFRELSNSGEATVLAMRRHGEGDQTGRGAGWITKRYRLAYLSALLFNLASRQRRKCQNGSGIDAPCQQPFHPAYLCPSADRGETAGKAPSGAKDFRRGY